MERKVKNVIDILIEREMQGTSINSDRHSLSSNEEHSVQPLNQQSLQLYRYQPEDDHNQHVRFNDTGYDYDINDNEVRKPIIKTELVIQKIQKAADLRLQYDLSQGYQGDQQEARLEPNIYAGKSENDQVQVLFQDDSPRDFEIEETNIVSEKDMGKTDNNMIETKDEKIDSIDFDNEEVGWDNTDDNENEAHSQKDYEDNENDNDDSTEEEDDEEEEGGEEEEEEEENDDDEEEEKVEEDDDEEDEKVEDEESSSESSEEELSEPGIKVLKGVYIVEAVVDKRVRNKTTEYLVKWLNYPASQSTWEPAHHFRNNIYVNQFEKELAKKKRKLQENEDRKIQARRYKAFKKECCSVPSPGESLEDESTEEEDETEEDETEDETSEDNKDSEIAEEQEQDNEIADEEMHDEEEMNEMKAVEIEEGTNQEDEESNYASNEVYHELEEDKDYVEVTEDSDDQFDQISNIGCDSKKIEMSELEMLELEADFAEIENGDNLDVNESYENETDEDEMEPTIFQEQFPSTSTQEVYEEEIDLDNVTLLQLQCSVTPNSEDDENDCYYHAIFEGFDELVPIPKMVAYSRWPEVVMKLQRKLLLQ